MHNWLVGFVLEVAVPTTSELWSRPIIHFVQLRFSRPDLYSGLDAVGGKWTGSLKVPFIKDGLLNFRNTTDKVIKTFGVL